MTDLMTVEELGKYLRFTKKTIYSLLKQGDLPGFKIGNKWRFDRELIDEWLRQRPKENNSIARIIVIDDDEILCELFKETLEEVGYVATVVTNPFRGLELVKENEFDLVFLDLKLPGMDGAEVFRQIRMNKPDLPVTIITGIPDSDLMMTALSYGPAGVMSKPFTRADILAAANNYLKYKSPVKSS